MSYKLPDINKPGLADIHCHILPGIDDGSRSMEESLSLLELSIAQGFRTFVATSHYRRTHANPDIEAMTEELKGRARERFSDIDIDIYPGQEGFWHEEFTERIACGEARRLADSSYILCEFDISAPFSAIQRGLRTISDYGLTPVLAHFERYAALREGDRVSDIKRLGVVMQMNYEVLAGGGLFDSNQRWCRRQVERGITDVLGTDMHRTDFRPPDTLGAQKWLKKALSPEHFDVLTRRNTLHIIRNEAIE